MPMKQVPPHCREIQGYVTASGHSGIIQCSMRTRAGPTAQLIAVLGAGRLAVRTAESMGHGANCHSAFPPASQPIA